MRVRGVLAAHSRELQQLDTLARQIAIALERVHYVDIAQQAVVQMEPEKLKSTLLAAISHDVRTPLTALISLAESLQRNLPAMLPAQSDMAQAITQQARQLSALVTNLLDMARLQNGSVHLRRDWQSAQEVVGSSIRAAQHALRGRTVQTQVPADLPLVEFDAQLMGRVLVNLLENAAKYGAAPFVVSAHAMPCHAMPCQPRWCSPCGTTGRGCLRRGRAARQRCSTSSRAGKLSRPRPAWGWGWRFARPWWTRTAAASRCAMPSAAGQRSACRFPGARHLLSWPSRPRPKSVFAI